MSAVTLAVVLKREKRTPEDCARVAEIARSLGFETTARGLATLSLRGSKETFEKTFGTSLKQVPSLAPSEQDAGAPPGLVAEGNIPVPSDLQDYVDSVSVVPPARRL